MLVSMHTPSLMAHTLAPAPAGRAAALDRPPVLAVAAPGKGSHSMPAAQELAEPGKVPGPATFPCLMSVDRGDEQAGLHLCGKLSCSACQQVYAASGLPGLAGIDKRCHGSHSAGSCPSPTAPRAGHTCRPGSVVHKSQRQVKTAAVLQQHPIRGTAGVTCYEAWTTEECKGQHMHCRAVYSNKEPAYSKGIVSHVSLCQHCLMKGGVKNCNLHHTIVALPNLQCLPAVSSFARPVRAGQLAAKTCLRTLWEQLGGSCDALQICWVVQRRLQHRTSGQYQRLHG